MASRPATIPHGNPIPNGWRLVRLEDVCGEIHRYPTYYNVPYVASGILEVRGELIEENSTLAKDIRLYRKITPEFSAKFNRTQLLEGDFVLTVRGTVGKVAYVPREFVGANITANLLRISPIPNVISSKWLRHLFTGTQFQARLQSIVTSTTIATVTGSDIKALQIRLPPLPEQRAIAEVLDSINEALEATEAVVAATEQLRDALLHRLLTRGVPGWHSEWKEVRGIGAIPASWQAVQLGDECTHVGSGVTPRGGKSAYVASGIIFLRSQNVHFDGLRLEDVAYISRKTDDSMRRSRVLDGDVLLNITGASIGRCTIVPRNLGPANVNQHVCIIRTTEAFNRYFVTKWLSTPRSQREIDDLQSGQSRQGLNYGQVRQIRIVQPPRFEQDRIAEILAGIDAAIEQGRAETAMLQSLKASAADALLTGRVRVGVPY